ncbi:MAG TPA: AAA family ATPase [Polyangiales bacterium]|nr:AAA family ATPase [Polyangiales bacterium]
MNCPHCSIPYDEAVAILTCKRCGGALPRRTYSSLPPFGPEGSERREATVLFCDLSGYTRWNEEEDPEEIALAMEVVRTEATRIIEDHGGIVNQFVGDEVMGLFGVLSSHEDDPRRAVAAALRFHEYMRDVKVFGTRRLHLHSGAETGLVYARVRDLRSGLFEITGEAVNTAARLRSLASDDEIVCGPQLGRRVQDFYRLGLLAPYRVHEGAQPIIPQRVVGMTQSSSPFQIAALRGFTPYVNREIELADLLAWWSRTEQGSGGLVKIGGEAGVGKTRFLHEFRARLSPEAVVLHGGCSSYRGVPPYQPFIDALRTFIDANPSTRAESVQQLSERWGLSHASCMALTQLLSPDSRTASSLKAGDLRSAIVDALRQIIGKLAVHHPLLVILEDWHWADEASRHALRSIAPDLDHLRAMVVVNFRSTELTESEQPDTPRQIKLRPLGPGATKLMAQSVLGAEQLPDGLSSFVHDRTLGNPFFVEEICRALVDDGACSLRNDSVELVEPLFQVRTPSTVQAILRARVDRLPEEQRDVLRLASVIGPEFSPDLLEALLDRRGNGLSLLAILEGLERHDLIHRESTHPVSYRFKHAITREVVYEGLPMRVRRLRHTHLARAIEARTPADELERKYETLANHYRLGAEHHKAIEFAVRAGDKAWRAFALEQAGLQYRHAIETLRQLADSDEAAMAKHIDVSLSWGKAGIYNPHVDQVAALRSSFVFARRLQDQRCAALCLNWLCWIEYGLGDHVASHAYAQRFLADAQSLGEPRLVAAATLNTRYGNTCDPSLTSRAACL